MSSKSLSGLRRSAPSEYLTSPALAKPAYPMHRPTNTRYVPVERLRPSSLDALHDACGQYGDAAVREAEWSAVSSFLMRLCPQVLHSNSMAAAIGAINLCRNADRSRGYPSLSGKPQLNELPNLPTESQAEAVRVANETVEEWRHSGRPHLLRAIASTHETVAMYQRRHPSPLEPKN